ncbi:uncharacterized protein SAPINGB_P003377 [Magnusiomyces paraingens]|uniref:Sugar phosphate transporter domain-containing protein n=1 Tax=Magnusiomyces paraingens TaxID=2606893 RepID=A0A5E8BUI5_9ASCO|nr:uncharacterized protein SAPINGB_P003377 [Saprochaete ingens]VVT53047.1 unnamed protein product [Saprochaete ingens]
MATVATTTSFPSFHKDVGKPHIQVQTRPLSPSISTPPHGTSGYTESPTSSQPFQNISESHHRNNPGIIGVSSFERSRSRSNSGSSTSSGNSTNRLPFITSDRRALFSHAVARPASPSLNHGSHVENSLEYSENANSQSFTGNRPRSRSLTQKTISSLAAPISLPLILLCISWYTSSVVSNTLNKYILTVFPYPVTLTMIQFFLAVCLGLSTIQLSQISHKFYKLLPAGTVSLSGFRSPTKEIIMSTLPMGIFQLFGHIFSHMATSQIPVSLVHTIKALSPLFTVAAYRVVFGVKYPSRTYLTLIPLTCGVIMTCSTQLSSQLKGIIYALIASLIFVSQNIYSKKLLTHRPDSTSGIPDIDNTPRIDKLNILCYCSSLAFILTSPLWFFSEGISFFSDYFHGAGKFFSAEDSSASNFLISAFLLNGLSHFLQNMLAFQVLGMVSPVTYSVASLIKRIAVVSVSIIWFGQKVSGVQQFGIILTFGGLYLYDKLGGDKTKKSKYTNISLHHQPTLPK